MKKIIRNIFIILAILVFMVAFSPSYLSLNIDNLAYVVALGIDKGENEKYEISFQFTKGIPSSDSGSSSETPLIVNSVQASSIDSAINIMNSYMAKQLNLSHCRLIIFSEEVASRGISNEIYTLANDIEVRPSANVIVSKSKAKDYIESSEPVLENLITKYYEIFPNSSKYTGYVYNLTFGDFYNQYICNTCETFAILGGVNSKNSTSSNSNIYNMKSSFTSFSGGNGAENIGIAVFKNDKLVGELTAIETLCLSIIRGEVDSFLVSIPDPQNNEEQIDVMLYPMDGNKIKTYIVNGSPYISFSTNLEGRIFSMKKGAKYLDSGTLDDISEAVNNYLNEVLTEYLYRTSKEFKSDINGFGKHFLSKFLTIQEYENFDWRNTYANSTFKVSINTRIDSGFLITET